MALIGIFIAIAIPLVSFSYVVGTGMAGGFKVPLACIFTLATAWNLSCATAFVCFRYLSRLRQRLLALLSIAFVGVVVSLGMSFLTSGFGVLASPTQDPWEGKFVMGDAVVLSIWGTFSGLCLGIGAFRWAMLLTDKFRIHTTTALIVSLLAAWLSIGLGIAVLFT